MAIPRDVLDRLFKMNENIQKAGFKGGLSDEEIRMYHQRISQGRQRGDASAMAPMPHPGMIPQAGFQGNSMFPNQGGGGLLREGQVPPPMSAPMLNPAGQAMPMQMNPSMQGLQNMLAQNAPAGSMPGIPGGLGSGSREFDTQIHIGADGNVNQIMLKRAMQKRAQMMGGPQMGGLA